MLMPGCCQAGLETKLGAIAGAVHVDGRDMTEALLASILRAAVPRGFDGVKHWHDGPAGLIRFAHATTPEAVSEVQPFISTRSGAVMVFDGRLDNRADLIAQLGAQGEGMKAAPDGEIALALFDRRGDDYVTSLVGDFAIAIWQPRDRRLLLVRSPYGWRPLVWSRRQDWVRHGCWGLWACFLHLLRRLGQLCEAQRHRLHAGHLDQGR